MISGAWRDNAIMFVMPGGADLAYAEKLNGLGNQMIEEFVAQGGTYLGISAGAYYASREIEFDRGGELEVTGSRELAFFPGKSIGPAISFYDYESNNGASAAAISCGSSSSAAAASSDNQLNLYHHGGGFFENAESYENVKVIASYVIDQNRSLPAIINAHYGQGHAILSGVHFEIDPFSERASIHVNEDERSIIELLQLTNQQREELIFIILKDIFTLTDYSEL